MRLSIRRIVKCCVIVLVLTLSGIFIRDDISLFTQQPSTFRRVRDSSVKSRTSGNGSNGQRFLLRTQRSAKSLQTSNVDEIQQSGIDRFMHGRIKRLPATTLDDVFISIKTTGKNHRSRMQILLETWISNAKNQTYIFTDEDDSMLLNSLPAGHVINTNCSSDHGRRALNCKMAQEFDLFITVGRRWFCHVDDDTYVNTGRLVSMLSGYNHTDDMYLGKPSLGHPIEVMDRSRPGLKMAFWFATGGAGFCISRALALKMIPHAGGGRLLQAGDHIRLPDDCTIGYIIDSILHKELTVIEEFHSHLEPLAHIRTQQIADQITFGYFLQDGRRNVVKLAGFPEEKDPTRFWSIHCHLHPLTKACLDHR